MKRSGGAVVITPRGSQELSTGREVTIHEHGRIPKRPKLSPHPSRGKENADRIGLGLSQKSTGLGAGSTKGKGKGKEREVSTSAEQALMDDLMAGLDASVFDTFESSPVKLQKLPTSSAKTPTKPARSPRSALSPIKRLVSPHKGPTRKDLPQTTVKRERTPAPEIQVKYEQDPSLPDLEPVDAKLETDEDLFDHFDIKDFFSSNEDLLDAAAQEKYPILHPPVPTPPKGYQSTPWLRCRVASVYSGLRSVEALQHAEQDDEYAGPSHTSGKTIVVRTQPEDVQRVIHLKDRWADVPVAAGDVVNVVSDQLDEDNESIILTLKDPRSFLIHHPDLMLTMTSIANAMPCPRRPILQSMLKVAGPSNKAMLYGTLLHTLLQRALEEQDFHIDFTRRRLNDELSKEAVKLDVWGADLGLENVRLEVGAKAGQEFATFGNRWIGSSPKSNGELHAVKGDTQQLLSINGLHEVEEEIWSPKWGLKGKVDASVQAMIVNQGASSDQGETHVAPLEIKTGKSVGVMAHRAQTMLYTLLMEDRYNLPVPAGLLYYSQLDSVLRVEAKENEIRALIMARNDLAHYLAKQRTLPEPVLGTQGTQYSFDDGLEDSGLLPPTIDHAKECRSCYAVDTCMLYRKIEERHALADDPIAELYAEKTRHLTSAHADFFKKWETLLTIEEQDIGKFRSQLWTMTAKQREKVGRCFSGMIISSYSNDLGKSLAKIHRHTYTFTRSSTNSQTGSLLHGHIAKGDPVSLSIEPNLLCLSRGFVTALTQDSITIGVTYVIDPKALLDRTQYKHQNEPKDQVEFRIDKDEMASGIMKMRANLAQLFFAGGAENLRRLVVDLAPPQFEPARLPKPEEIPASLNPDQAQAMRRALSAKDYALILGMPGTGKTSTIAEIIKALVERGKSVLLTSYTHSAVDTILMKLVNAEFAILRLGNIDKVHPDVQHLTLEALDASTSMPQFEARLMGPPVVASTCLAIDHPLFFRRRFDYCIVDEASQITLPTCLGPLRMADTFILVGDHFQLPPIVRNADAKRGGLDISLFKMLSEAHTDAVTDLSLQYRMNEDIMLLSNELIYEGRLRCGSNAVARQSLALSKELDCGSAFPGGHGDTPCWTKDLINENVKAIFVDTDAVPALDSKIGSLVQNKTEARLIHQLATALTSCGVKENDIAIITPLQQQIKLLTGLFTSLPRIEILTADKSQGRDKECILISLVRSNKDGNIGDLLRDWRRINVSFTRAKRKLVIFGSRSTLSSDPLLGDFLGLMHRQGWIYPLPASAHRLHGEVEVKREEAVKHDGAGGRSARVGERVLGRSGVVSDILADAS